MPGVAANKYHHHFCGKTILATIELDQLDIGTCEVCGRHLFISTNESGTTYELATPHEEELITALINARAQIAKARSG